MAPNQPAFSEGDRLLGRACFNHTVVVWWGEPDVPGSMNSGSGVLVQLDRPFLITAGHVISAHLVRLQQSNSIVLRVGDGILDRVTERIVALSETNPDLATLDLSGVDDSIIWRTLNFSCAASMATRSSHSRHACHYARIFTGAQEH